MNAKPYRPPGAPKHVGTPPEADKLRPWMALKDGETEREWHQRMSHTCYDCGAFIVDTRLLNLHESEH